MSTQESSTFKQEVPYEKRKNLSQIIKQKYPDRIPIIVEPSCEKDPKILRRKYLAPDDITMGHLFREIRKHVSELSPEMGLSFYVKDKVLNKSLKQNSWMNIYSWYNYGKSHITTQNENYMLIPVSQLIKTAYNNYKDDDGFLYVIYSIENTFG